MNEEMKAFLQEHHKYIDLEPDDMYHQWQALGGAGKFEGEPLYVQYFYEQSLDGGDAVLEITAEEQKTFDLGPNDNYVYLYESEDGFVTPLYFALEDDAQAAWDEDHPCDADEEPAHLFER